MSGRRAAPAGRRLFLYNTVCEIVLYDFPGDPAPLLDGCERIACGVRALLDAYDPDSELGRLNRLHRTGRPYVLSPELYGLLRRIDCFSRLCGGAFDATIRPLVELWDFTASKPAVPSADRVRTARERCGYRRICYDDRACAVTFTVPGMSVDAGGVGKGYAAGRVADYLRESGVASASINFGGELYLLGGRGEHPWRVGVQRPWAPRGETVGSLALRDCAVASSGGYDRFFEEGGKPYCHILDPRTGYPAAGELQGITAVCADPVLAELVSTALFVLGERAGARLLAKMDGAPVHALLVGEGIVTPLGGMAGVFCPADEIIMERRNSVCASPFVGTTGKRWIG